MKVIVYTATCGGYDPPRDDILCFTEQDYNRFHDHRRNSRIFKILPHLWLPDCDWSIWIDANIYLKVEPEALVARAQETLSTWCVFEHNYRKTVWEEFRECHRLFKDNPETLNEHETWLRSEGHYGTGLAMCGIQVRNMRVTRRACERWWSEYCRWSTRDQLSFPHAVGPGVAEYWPKVKSYDNEWFRLVPHGRKP